MLENVFTLSHSYGGFFFLTDLNFIGNYMKYNGIPRVQLYIVEWPWHYKE